MIGNSSRNGRQSLEDVEGQFQVWRRQRTRGQRIPDPLWQAAIALYPRYSVYKISRTLRLDHMDLKARVGLGEKRRSKGRQDPQFIELPFTSSAADTSECMVKVRDRRGSRIHIKVKGTGVGPLLETLKGLLAEKL
jgi:hypothetical protein|tara:strand:- start:293 stop:700 length:408 start_codon:yes stop_codon:yes gene_type:complete